MITPSTTTKRALIGSILIFVVAVGLYVYASFTIQKMTSETATLSADTVALERRVLAVGDIKKDLANAKDRQDVLLEHFVDKENVVPFFTTIESYGKSSGVSVKFDTASSARDVNRFDIALSIKGPYTGVYKFLRLLEATPYEIVVNTIQLQSGYVEVPVSKTKIVTQVEWTGTVSLSLMSVLNTKK